MLPICSYSNNSADMSFKPLKTVDDLAREELNLRVTCENCSHAVILDTRALSDRLFSLRKSRKLALVAERLKCSACRSKKVVMWPTDTQPTPTE